MLGINIRQRTQASVFTSPHGLDWIERKDLNNFMDLATIENLHHSESDVMLIYDRNLDLYDLSKLKDFCKGKEWKC